MSDPHVALTEKRRAVDPAAPKVACVYRFTCIKNGHAYIGQTVWPLEKYFKSKRRAKNPKTKKLYPIARAIKKYGRKGFRIETLCVGTVEYCRDVMERKLIAAYGTLAPNGYNINEGGEGWTSADARRWANSPEGREVLLRNLALGREVYGRRAGHPSRRVNEMLENADGWLSKDSIADSLKLTKNQVRCAISYLNQHGHYIIQKRGSAIYRSVTLEEAADRWAYGRALTNEGRVLRLLMGGPRTIAELMDRLRLPRSSVDCCIPRMCKNGYNIECRGARGSIPGTFHLIQDEHHPWLHLGVMDFRGAAHDDRE